MKTHIIIGSSAAGLGVLSRLRQLDPLSRIICITASSEMPYNTCLMADVLAGDRKNEDIYTKGEDFFSKNHIELFLGGILEKIDPRLKKIYTTSGEFTYDTLFLGLGTSFISPPITGAENCKRFHTLEDTNNLLKSIKGARKVIVIGGGLSGVECADALTSRGIKVTLIERANSVLPSQVDVKGAALIEDLMVKHGTTIHKSFIVRKIIPNKVFLDGGEVIVSDFVVMATGGKPNIKIASEAGIKVEEGIVVDEFMQTSIPDIYAGGDCAALKNVFGRRVRSTTWPDAMLQGICAAFSMASKPREYLGVLPIGSSNFYDTTFVSCGPVVNPGDYEVVTREGECFYHKFLLHDGRLRGFLMVGKVDHLGFLRKLVMSKKEITKEKLLSYFEGQYCE